jgi:pimeloyl-ACP methyl ester carboxylesterase
VTTSSTTTTTSVAPDPAPNVVGGIGLSGVVGADDTTVAVLTVLPEGFTMGQAAPVVLAFPPGDQSLDTTSALVDGTYEEEALARGLVVVSPVAPGGISFWRGSEVHVGPILDWIETWVEPEGGLIHLLGVSNGGVSVFRAADLHQGRFASLTAFPGYPRGEGEIDAVVDVPVRLFVGGADEPWIEPMETFAAELEGLGGDVELEVIPDAPHFIPQLADGVVLFDTLDELRP